MNKTTTQPDLFAGVLPFFFTAEALSFSKAAQRLGVSAAAVSKSVQKLEESLGVKLLLRTSRHVSLTPEGTLFLERCRAAITSLQSGRDLMVSARKMPRGQIHVTIPFILGRPIVKALPQLAARFPDLSYRFSITDRLVSLVDETVDVAVRIGILEDSSLVARLLTETRWSTVAAPSVLVRRGIPTAPKDLDSNACLYFVTPGRKPREFSFRDPKTGESIVSKASPRLLIDEGEHLLEAAVAGLGFCQVLDFMVKDALREGRLVAVLEDYSAPGPPIHAVTTKERSRSPNVRAFLLFLKEVFEGLKAIPVT